MSTTEFETYWRSLSEDETRRQFDMRVAVPDGPSYSDHQLDWSRLTRERLGGALDVRYGEGPGTTLDIFAPQRSNAPVVMFWHGGGWQNNSKSHFSFIAEPLVAAGVAAVIVGYDLFPAVDIRRMMHEAREAVAWVARNIEAYGGDPRRIVVAGHSAGAQLGGMALADSYTSEGLAVSPVRGAMLISGSFDMRVHRRHPRYLALLPDEETAIRASIALHPPHDTSMPLVLAVGAAETAGYVAQTRLFAKQMKARGHPVEIVETVGDHHFSIIDRLADPAHPLTRSLIALAQR